jgi:hypothetical protein
MNGLIFQSILILISTNTYTYTYISMFISNEWLIHQFCCYDINWFDFRLIRSMKYSWFKSWMILTCLMFLFDVLRWLYFVWFHFILFHFILFYFVWKEIVSIQSKHSISFLIVHFIHLLKFHISHHIVHIFIVSKLE